VSLLPDIGDEQLDERTLRKMEAGTKPCRLSKLALLARVFGCPVDQLIKGRGGTRWAMMDEVLASAKAAMTNEGGSVLERLFYAIERPSDGYRLEMELLLALAIRRDVMGDSRGALRLALLLEEESQDSSLQFRTRALVRLASFYDHLGEPAKGLAVLNRLHRQVAMDARLAREVWWIRYQQGTLLAHDGHVQKAERILKAVRAHAPSDAMRTAALHQLGVIKLKQRDFGSAEIFLVCLKERLARSRDDFRTIYEHRRLGEIYVAQGDLRRARPHLRSAERILRRWTFKRYENKLRHSIRVTDFSRQRARR
jgi:tetratricopeptide (TPR) repeat protein